MDDLRFAATVRRIRVRLGLRQFDLATRCGVSQSTISRIERGHIESLPLATLRHVAAVLEIRLDLVPRWCGGDLDRLLNARHSALHERVARNLGRRAGWIFQPEVSFAIFAERGIIDILAFHPGRRALLVIELKTDIVDINELVGTLRSQGPARSGDRRPEGLGGRTGRHGLELGDRCAGPDQPAASRGAHDDAEGGVPARRSLGAGLARRPRPRHPLPELLARYAWAGWWAGSDPDSAGRGPSSAGELNTTRVHEVAIRPGGLIPVVRGWRCGQMGRAGRAGRANGLGGGARAE